jgi:hypothetical protein
MCFFLITFCVLMFILYIYFFVITDMYVTCVHSGARDALVSCALDPNDGLPSFESLGVVFLSLCFVIY